MKAIELIDQAPNSFACQNISTEMSWMLLGSQLTLGLQTDFLLDASETPCFDYLSLQA
jgi:hypothetical protein